MTPNADYRALLLKYMRHVAECEGLAFLRDGDRGDGFTDEEWAELKRLEAEADL